MASSRFMKLNVFPRLESGGNDLGVILNAKNWTTEQMQAFAKETNIVETTFILEHNGPNYKCRIFTPEKEIPFAGHPTIGTAYAALYAKLIVPDENNMVYQECGNRITPIKITNNVFQFESPKANIVDTEGKYDKEIKAALSELECYGTTFISGGRNWFITECVTEHAIRNWKPNFDLVKDLAIKSNSMGICVFYRYLDEGIPRMVVRAFPAGVNIIEDPASGAANGLIASYISLVEELDFNEYYVSQGLEMGHDAELVISFDNDKIWVGGKTTIISDTVVERKVTYTECLSFRYNKLDI